MSTLADKPNAPKGSATTIIDGIASINEMGVFRNYAAAADVPAFGQYNLIYGFNGTGKTTLSRIFNSIGEGRVHPELPPQGAFSVKTRDGNTISSSNGLDYLQGKLFVFNVDFIEENLNWKSGEANPIFYIGKAQAELVSRIESIEKELQEFESQIRLADKDYNHCESSFKEHKRAAAKLIASELALGRQYTAHHLDQDYSKGIYGQGFRLDEAECDRQKAIFKQDVHLPKFPKLLEMSYSLLSKLGEVKDILAETVVVTLLEELKQHDSMLPWVKQGRDYHSEHELSTCLLCGGELSPERLAALGQAIDERLEKLIQTISAQKSAWFSFNSQLSSIRETIPSANDLYKGLQDKFLNVSNALKQLLHEGESYTESVMSLLDKKAAAPNTRIDYGELITENIASSWELAIADQIKAYNEIIEEHNKVFDDFDKVRQDAQGKVKGHYLAEGDEAYRKMQKAATEAKAVIQGLEDNKKEKRQRVERLKKDIKNHGPAAEKINQMVQNYLGHSELQVGMLEEGYQIHRHGKELQGPLSEGEKTALALCYFLCNLEADNRKLRELVVVLDDPISSLDTKALNYAFNLIKASLQGVGQLIVLTHNLHFMNEVKKWLKNKAEDGKASLLFLDAKQEAGLNTRYTVIQKMPKLIRDHESEYHYLFYRALQFSKSSDGHENYLYLMPNVLRKLLEVFLAFKFPGNEGLANKMDKVAIGNYGLDASRVRALERLANVESHGDNLDSLLMLSSLTLEEVKDANDALLELIKSLDPEHHKLMCRMCNRGQ